MIGKVYGKYELLEKIGEGGMAELYLARHSGIGGFKKQVALKMIHSSLADTDDSAKIVQMFLDEARLAAHLDHPHIVQIYELGEADGLYFIAMEYVDGIDLARVGQLAYDNDRPVPIHHAVKVMSFVCEALAFAHQVVDSDGRPLHLVHRDVSPQNVLIGFNGSVKLTDFGVAKATLQVVKTEIGSIKGKLGYMSPEQIRSEPLDGRSDIFGAGILLYEITTGRRPFSGKSEMSILEAIVSKAPPPPATFRPDYPPELSIIVERALAKRAEDRFQDALEMQMALEQFLLSNHAVSNASLIARYARDLVEAAAAPEEAGLEQTVPGVLLPGGELSEITVPTASEAEEHTVRTPMPPVEPPTIPRIHETAGDQITERAQAPDPESLGEQPTDEDGVFATSPQPRFELEKIAPIPSELEINGAANTLRSPVAAHEAPADAVTDPRAAVPAPPTPAEEQTAPAAAPPDVPVEVEDWHPPTDRVVPLSGGGRQSGPETAPAAAPRAAKRNPTMLAVAVAATAGFVVMLAIGLVIRLTRQSDPAPPPETAVTVVTLLDAAGHKVQPFDAGAATPSRPDAAPGAPEDPATASPPDAAAPEPPQEQEAVEESTVAANAQAESRDAPRANSASRTRASNRAAESVKSLCQEGNRAVLQGNLEQAAALFERAYRKDPRTQQARRGLVLTYRKSGRTEKAERYNMTGNRLLLRGDNSGAIKMFKLALESDILAADAHRGLGIAYSKTNDNRSAVRHFKAYLVARPNASNADEVREAIRELKQNKR